MTRRPGRGAFTLVELMVAVALGMILVGVITFVWMQSNKIFATTVHRLESYQRLRTVLDIMERDLANTNRTVNMEFYVDKTPNGHFDGTPDDALLETKGGQHFREPRDDFDPLVIKKEREFGIDALNDEKYFFSPLVLSPPPYSIGAGYTDNRVYWQDEVYVRAFATVDGVNRPALIHYRLVRTDDGRSALRRRVWFLNENQKLEVPQPKASPPVAGTDRTAILSHGMGDLKVGFYFKQTPSESTGSWYHVGLDPSAKGTLEKGLWEADQARGFKSARDVKEGLSAQHLEQFGAGVNAIAFHYEGSARIEETPTLPPVLRTLKSNINLDDNALKLRPGNKTDLDGYERFDFPGVRPGDRFLVYEATDDDDAQSAGAKKKAEAFFPDQILTVDTIFSDITETFVAVKFREQIDFNRLRKTWLGSEPDVQIDNADLGSHPHAGPAPKANPPSDPVGGRLITASFNIKYRVGFLPAAFLIRLSCDDRHNNKVLPMERVIRLVQQ